MAAWVGTEEKKKTRFRRALQQRYLVSLSGRNTHGSDKQIDDLQIDHPGVSYLDDLVPSSSAVMRGVVQDLCIEQIPPGIHVLDGEQNIWPPQGRTSYRRSHTRSSIQTQGSICSEGSIIGWESMIWLICVLCETCLV